MFLLVIFDNLNLNQIQKQMLRMAYFNSLKEVSNYLMNGHVECSIKNNLFPKYHVFYLSGTTEERKLLRIEEYSDGFWGTTIGAKKRPIGSMDLTIKKDQQIAEIDWWMINDELQNKWTPDLYPPQLSLEEAKEMNKLLLSYAENEAKQFGCNKIKRDVHNSLNEYNFELKDNGFVLTGEKADDHNAWLKTYKYL